MFLSKDINLVTFYPKGTRWHVKKYAGALLCHIFFCIFICGKSVFVDHAQRGPTLTYPSIIGESDFTRFYYMPV